MNVLAAVWVEAPDAVGDAVAGGALADPPEAGPDAGLDADTVAGATAVADAAGAVLAAGVVLAAEPHAATESAARPSSAPVMIVFMVPLPLPTYDASRHPSVGSTGRGELPVLVMR
jgi:hypothetical protein